MTLYESLRSLDESDMLPLHMPGHKRSDLIPSMRDVYSIDITEIDGFDDLHDPTGMIADMQSGYASHYGADRAWLSVNGSTAAVEAAIMAACRSGDKMIISRGSHRSVYYAAAMGHLEPVYIPQSADPETGILFPPAKEDVERACAEHPDAKAVVITSPTYEGLIADTEAIAQIVHSHGMILICDAAHGAHLQPGGADIAAVSLHKMLPAPTQTALLLLKKEYADEAVTERLDRYMHMLQTSSPSYVLMAGAGECLEYLKNGFADDDRRVRGLAEKFRNEVRNLKHICVKGAAVSDIGEGIAAIDPYKIVISSADTSVDGRDLYLGLLNKYNIQCEMCSYRYALALFSVADDESSFDRLRDALIEMDAEVEAGGSAASGSGSDSGSGSASGSVTALNAPDRIPGSHIPASAMTPAQALDADHVYISWDDIKPGMVSAEYICIYPPGIPTAAPGEIIDDEVIAQIADGYRAGLKITGIRDGRVAVVTPF